MSDEIENKSKFLAVGDAVQTASYYLHSIIPDTQDVLVEEVEKELMDGGKLYWNITLSFTLENKYGLRVNPILGKRVYKLFKIDATNGEVISMKIRNV